MTAAPALAVTAADVEVALVAAPWSIAGRTYSAADVFRAVDPAGYALFRDLVRAEHALAE